MSLPWADHRVIDRFILAEVCLARQRLAQGDVAGAAAMLTQVEQSVRPQNFVHRMPEVAAAQVQVLLRQGKLEAAAQLAQVHPSPAARHGYTWPWTRSKGITAGSMASYRCKAALKR